MRARTGPATAGHRPAAGLLAALLLLAAAGVALARQSPAMEEASEDVGDVLTIRAMGRAYWWDVVYRDPIPSRLLRTANQIHIPAGQPVRLEIRPGDGAGRIWVPRAVANGVLPAWGRTVTLRADEPGIHRARPGDLRFGRPRMDLLIVVQTPEAFAAWHEDQLRPATPPADARRAEGERLFLSTGCALCHTVRGTRALAAAGPDLTHFATRATIAAGLVPNNRGHLGAWLADPQRVKPGSLMPPVPLEGWHLQALIDYLHGLR